jgi:hypothetical protein
MARFIQSIPLQDRLLAFIHAMRERAELVPPGPERDELLKKVKKAENAVEMEQRVAEAEAASMRGLSPIENPAGVRNISPASHNDRNGS